MFMYSTNIDKIKIYFLMISNGSSNLYIETIKAQNYIMAICRNKCLVIFCNDIELESEFLYIEIVIMVNTHLYYRSHTCT